MAKESPEFRTVSLASIVPGGKIQFWLTQEGITSPVCQWRTVVSSEDADNDDDALKIAHDRYRAGQPSEKFEEPKKSEKPKKPKKSEAA